MPRPNLPPRLLCSLRWGARLWTALLLALAALIPLSPGEPGSEAPLTVSVQLELGFVSLGLLRGWRREGPGGPLCWSAGRPPPDRPPSPG